VTQTIIALLAGLIIAFLYSWLTTSLVLLAIPIMVIAGTIHAKLIWNMAGSGKKDYETAGNVRMHFNLS